MDPFGRLRQHMVKEQIAARGITNQRVLNAMFRIPRHEFVPAELQPRAYEDVPLPIGQGQTISQPYMVAIMASLLELEGTERVLEVGTGCGYAAAVLAELAAEVHTIEYNPHLAASAGETLTRLGYPDVHIHRTDGSLGWSESAPYDGISVTAAAPAPPQPLIDQLAEGGRLIIPIGARGRQDLRRYQRVHGRIEYESLFPVAFVPMRGKFGWSEQEWGTDE